MSEQTHWRKLTNPDYLGAYALEPGQDITATIKSVRVENIIGADGKKEDCPVMRFVEQIKPMILNVTNAKTLEKLFKTPFIENWSGRKIQIGVESVKAFGDVVDALRIRKFLPKEVGTAKCSDCQSEITAAGGMNAAQVVAFSQKRFGATLCAACMKKLDEAKKAAQEAQNEPETGNPVTDGTAPAEGNETEGAE